MQSNERKIQRIAIIGFGEAGGILGQDLAKQGCVVRTYDILVNDARGRTAHLDKARACNVIATDNMDDALRDADLIVSAVTASSARDVAQGVAKLIKPFQVFFDINSISPEAKQLNAQVIGSAGAHYVEAAVMAPVPPQRLKVPMLLGGAKAKDLANELKRFGMNTTAVSEQIGVASAIKMCRSIMIKGLEALTLECMFTARRYGAEDAVLASLHASFPSLGFNAEFPDYLISRVAEHGRRRAAEMREVAQTVGEVGLPPIMASATAQRQDALIDAMHAAGYEYNSQAAFSWRVLADRLASTSSATE
jgi:3-hydroxyisobutyrate dehydrogenase-like beta-hydroxyacid dehydrogenase